jgi:hypothetical protein
MPITESIRKAGAALSDMPINKSGTVGTEPIARKKADGSYERGVEVKFGRAGTMFVPTDKIKRYVRRAGDAAKTVGKLGVAVATEPFTQRILKENMALTDKKLSEQDESARERKQGLAQRYSPKK